MVRIMLGQGWRTIRKPPLSNPTGLLSLSTTSASIVGKGRVALLGLSGVMIGRPDHDRAGFRLPPCIHDGQFFVADIL